MRAYLMKSFGNSTYLSDKATAYKNYHYYTGDDHCPLKHLLDVYLPTEFVPSVEQSIKEFNDSLETLKIVPDKELGKQQPKTENVKLDEQNAENVSDKNIVDILNNKEAEKEEEEDDTNKEEGEEERKDDNNKENSSNEGDEIRNNYEQNNSNSESDNKEQEEDKKKEGKLLPVVFFIHGGGWKRGDKEWWYDSYGNMGKTFAAAGYIGIVPSYRLAPKFKHPYQTEDVAKAIKWVYDNIHHFGGDRERIVLTGHSAGAHIVALLALDVSYLQKLGLPHSEKSTFIKAVVGACGPYNIRALYDDFKARIVYIKDVFGTNLEDLANSSPVHKARANAPPMLLLNAYYDLGLHPQTEELRNALKACSEDNIVETNMYPGTDHVQIMGMLTKKGIAHPPLVKDSLEFIKRFV